MTLTEYLQNYPATTSRVFGNFIKHKREEMGFSCRGFAIELGISAVYLSDIENNHRPAPQKLLKKLMLKLGVQEDEKEAFYDLANLTRETVEPEIIQYLIANPEARKSLRVAIKKNISGKELLEMVENKDENLTI